MTDEKRFTQEQVTGIVAKAVHPYKEQIAELERKIGDYETVKTELTKAGEGLASQLKAMTAERDATRVELQGAQQKHAGALATARGHVVAMQLQQALLAARALPEAIDVAVRELQRAGVIEAAEDGSITAITIGAERFTDPRAAAQKWLEGRPYFVRATGMSGAGTRPHTGQGLGVDRDDDANKTPGQMMAEGLSRGARS